MAKRFSETAADTKSAFSLFRCIATGRYVNRLKFFSEVEHEIERVKSERESPEIIALLADWGQGKSFFLDILKEYGDSYGVKVVKEDFLRVLDGWAPPREGVVLIDEVESLVDPAIFSKYREKIRDFWIDMKNLANSKGSSIIYLSMTPSAFNKIFGTGGQVQSMFQETFPAFLERVKKVTLSLPSKLEFLMMLRCSLTQAGFADDEVVKYLEFMDLPFWVTSPERRKYTRLVNEILLNRFPSVEATFHEIARGPSKTLLNDEEETVKEKELLRLEDQVEKVDRDKIYRALMKRVGITEDELVEPLKSVSVRGGLVPYSQWLQITSDLPPASNLEDFLLTVKQNRDTEDSLYVFVSDELESVIYEGLVSDSSSLQKIKERALSLATGEFYALRWDFYERLVNANVGGLIVDFKSREDKENALRFVNENLADTKKFLEALISFIRISEPEWKVDKPYVTANNASVQISISDKRVNLEIIYPTPDLKNVNLNQQQKEILHALLVIRNDFLSDESTLRKLLEETRDYSVSLNYIDVPTPMKRQLLYMLFSHKTGAGSVRPEVIEIKLGELKREVEKVVDSAYRSLIIPQLPMTGKRLIQSFNWLMFYPLNRIAETGEVFERTDAVVNQKFRIFGSKQFHLEDFETENVLEKEVIPYLVSNHIIKLKNGLLDFQDLYGDLPRRFSKVVAGYLRQNKYQDYIQFLINFFISSASGSSDEKFTNLVSKVMQTKPDQSLVFLTYVSLISGELIRNLNNPSIVDSILKRISEMTEGNRDDFFLTAKRRDAGIRSLREMRSIMAQYKDTCMKSKEDLSYLRFCASYVALHATYERLSSLAEENNEEAENKVKTDVLKKVAVVANARKFLNINEETDEETLVNCIMKEIEDVTELSQQMGKTVGKLYSEGQGENFKRVLDESLSAISMDQDQPIHVKLFSMKVLKYTLDGVRVPILDLLKDVEVFEKVNRLKPASRHLVDLEILLDSVTKAMPELPLVRKELSEISIEIEGMIKKIKDKVREIED